ncbi:MAG: transglutaminase domain-containing protein [Bacteroidales bacterium]|nr:transglutaminase domain-containing protein [Bacteroidales bacterium]
MNSIAHIADRVMPAARNNFQLHKVDYDTSDIIELLIASHKKCLGDTAELARSIKATGTEDYIRKLYNLVKQNVTYKLDPPEAQFVKSPAQVWRDKFSDCKSYSLFIATTLHNAGIPFKYRFVSFSKSRVPTHVYVIVPKQGSGYITLDAVMPGYNQEKPFTFKKDIDMKGLYYVSGIGAAGKRRVPSLEQRARLKKRTKKTGRPRRLRRAIPVKFDLKGRNPGNMTQGEMDLLIARDRMTTCKSIAENIRGIGSVIGEKYQDSIDMIDDALEVVNDHKMGFIGAVEMEEELADIADDAVSGEYSLHKRMAGIGDLQEREQIRIGAKSSKKAKRKAKRKEKKAKKKEIKKTLKGKEKKKAMKELRKSYGTKTGKFLRKVAKTAVKVTKAVTKVATLPQRMIIKGILEIQLPKAAPFFLYLFINDKALIEKMPTKARNKRKKAEKIADFIVEGIGMKRNHLMGIFRNGIMKKYGKSPEDVIAEQMKGKVSGVGYVQIIGAVVGVVVKLIKAIAKLFKGKKGKVPSVSKDDAPDPTDWGESTAAAVTAMASAIKSQPENTQQYTDQMTTETTGSQTSSTVLTTRADQADQADQAEQYDSSSADDSGNQFESGGRSIWDSLKG